MEGKVKTLTPTLDELYLQYHNFVRIKGHYPSTIVVNPLDYEVMIKEIEPRVISAIFDVWHRTFNGTQILRSEDVKQGTFKIA